MTISNNPPAVTLDLSAGEAEALDLLLLQRQKEAEKQFTMHQAMMVHSAGDVELCIQMRMKLRGESTADRYRFKTNEEKIRELQAQQEAQSQSGLNLSPSGPSSPIDGKPQD